MLDTGCEGRAELVVGPQHTARALGSGDIAVFSTPSLVALMEQAAVHCLAGKLPEGMTSVGVSIDVKHLAATPPGLRVEAWARLVDVHERRLVFEVVARDPTETVGTGRHVRSVVNASRFLEKARIKKENRQLR